MKGLNKGFIKLSLLLGVILVLALIGLVLFKQSTLTKVSADAGAIWTTTGSCGDPQDSNHYHVGDHVFINAAGFDANTSYPWDITGQPNSGDSNAIVASGNHSTDGNGAVCFDAYTIQPGDYGEYKASFGSKHDNYRLEAIAIDGACGSTLDSCTAGTFHNITDNDTQYLWECLGIDGGTTAQCSLDKEITPTPTPTTTPTAYHYACVDDACVLVEGDSRDTCEIDEDCEGEVSPTPTIPEPTPTEAEPTPTTAQSNGGGGGGGGGSAPECNNTIPGAPTILSATSIGGNSVRVTWTKVTPADSYTILYGPSTGNYPYSVFSTGDTDNFTINGISTGCFAIKAVNGCMPGPLSAELCTGGVLGASTGNVLGASTMGATGGLTNSSITLMAQIGLILIGLGLIRIPLKRL